MALLQIRLEYDAIQAHDDQSGWLAKIIKWFKVVQDDGIQNVVSNSIGYKAKDLRVVGLCGIAVCLLMSLFFTGVKVDMTYVLVLLMIIGFNILPVWLIYKHEGMKKVAKKFFNNLIPDSLITLNI